MMPNGNGVMRFVNGDKFTGIFKDGLPSIGEYLY